jgi:hypothetical protein
VREALLAAVAARDAAAAWEAAQLCGGPRPLLVVAAKLGGDPSAKVILQQLIDRLPDETLEKAFIKAATERQLVDLKGHRSVGGIRASIYNAMPVAGVESLRDYMLEFQRQQRG